MNRAEARIKNFVDKTDEILKSNNCPVAFKASWGTVIVGIGTAVAEPLISEFVKWWTSKSVTENGHKKVIDILQTKKIAGWREITVITALDLTRPEPQNALSSSGLPLANERAICINVWALGSRSKEDFVSSENLACSNISTAYQLYIGTDPDLQDYLTGTEDSGATPRRLAVRTARARAATSPAKPQIRNNANATD